MYSDIAILVPLSLLFFTCFPIRTCLSTVLINGCLPYRRGGVVTVATTTNTTTASLFIRRWYLLVGDSWWA